MTGSGEGTRVADYHVHSHFSDGEGEPAELVERALTLGLPAIGFADHLTPETLGDEGDYGIGRDRLDAYVAAVRNVAARYPEIQVLLAVEADYLPDAEDELADILDGYPFDYVICGLHYVDGFSFSDTPYRSDRRWGDIRLYARYYALVRRAMQTRLFDVLAHIDYVRLWGHPLPGDVGADENGALDAMAASGAALEVNTTGTLDPAGRMYPAADLLVRARERGIPIVFGSDAHAPDQVGWRFADGVALARGAGYETWRELPARRERPLG